MTAGRAGVLVAALCSLALAACGGSAGSGAGAPDAVTPEPGARAPVTAAPGWTLADPDGFAALVAHPDVFTVNVHVPDEGQIDGTDVTIPYDRVEEFAAALPADRSAPLAVYCRTARMSTEAIPVLRELGFTDVTELAGGFHAWEATGRTLLPAGSVPAAGPGA